MPQGDQNHEEIGENDELIMKNGGKMYFYHEKWWKNMIEPWNMVEHDEFITPDTVLAAEKWWKMMIQPRKMVENGSKAND